ncbi:MAG: hypothetical protein JSR37_02310 [Verrucomicrobia bacterium]|nr:hypothetical protein [Verrucomicrobiota bacterium]MBS0637885.1 hypothetical protein [Verrucomicrobiota bacterium]
MLIGSAQNMWARIEPLVAPAAVGLGATLAVSYLYGSVAACCFGAVLVGAGIELHDTIVNISKNEIFVGIARLVAMAVLPFFGTWGIFASVGIAAFSSFSLDVRLHAVRQKQKEADRLIQTIQRQREALQKELQTMAEERTTHNARLEAFFKGVKPLDAIIQTLDRFEESIKKVQSSLEEKLAQEDYTAANDILDEISRFKAFVDKTAADAFELHKHIAAITVKLEGNGHAVY